MGKYEPMLRDQLIAAGINAQAEHRFIKPRLFKFDVVVVTDYIKLAVEIDGGNFVGGGHVSAKGIRSGHVKGYFAAVLGWTMIHVLPEDVVNGEAVLRVKSVLNRVLPVDYAEYGKPKHKIKTQPKPVTRKVRNVR